MKNFGGIKNAFNEILAEAIIFKDDKKKSIFKKYVKTIKENNALKTQFLLYYNIESRVDANEISANMYITENIRLLDKFKKEDIIKANSKLINISSLVKDKLNNEYDTKLSKLHEALSALIFTDINIKNINQLTENRFSVIRFINENKEIVVESGAGVPNSMLSSIISDKFNDKYSNLSESEMRIVKTMVESDDIEKEKIYKNTLTECIDLIDTKLSNSNIELKDKLLKVKDKLLRSSFTIERFNEDISKMLELKNDLETTNE